MFSSPLDGWASVAAVLRPVVWDRSGRWGWGWSCRKAPRLWGGDPDTQVRAHQYWENGFVPAFYLEEQGGKVRRPRWGDLQGCDPYQRDFPTLRAVGFSPFSWLGDAADPCFFWNRFVVIPEVAGLPLLHRLCGFFLSSSWLSIGICLYWSLNSPVPGLGKLPACLHWCYIGASSSPCVLLTACNLPCLFKVENVLHLQLHLGFWNCCGPRCLNCFRLLF